MQPMAKSSCRSCIATRTYDLIVFDLDGVVIDSAPDIVAAARYTLRQFGNQERDYAFIRSCIGGGARNLLLRCLDDDKKSKLDKALKVFKSHYEQNCTKETVLFPGVRETLTVYAGKKKLALATFKTRSATLKILEEFKVLDYFDMVVTADDVERPKPDPECVNQVLQALKCSADRAILVGDTKTDVFTGKNAGVATCAVLYGIGSLEELKGCNPDFLVENILDLKKIVAV